MFQFLRGFALIVAMMLNWSPTVVYAQSKINCDIPNEINPEAALIKRLTDYESGLREMKLPKEKQDRLMADGKKILLKNYATAREMEAFCDRERNGRASADDRARERRILRDIEEQTSRIERQLKDDRDQREWDRIRQGR